MAQELSEKTSRSKSAASNGDGAMASPRLPVSRSSSGIPWWTWVLIAVILAGAGLFAYRVVFKSKPAETEAGIASGSRHGGRGGAANQIRVVGATATTGDIGVYLADLLGAVTPLNTVTVKSRVDGQLMKVLFTEGQMVKKGDSLLQIDPRPYQAQLEQYTAQKEHDQALLDNAKVDLDRYQTLWKQDSIPQQTLATQQALVKQDQGTVDSDQALIDATQLNITYCNITAPISGRVGLRLVDEGNMVHASDTTGLLVITQIQPITVVFPIPEDSVPEVMSKLNAGQQLPVEAYDRVGKKKLAEGTLLTGDNQIDQTTGTLKLKAVFSNEDNALFPNQFVKVRLLLETKKDVTLIPVAAVQHGAQDSTFVYVVNMSEKTVSMKDVVVGTIDVDGNTAEIQSGISPGDTVVIDGVDKLQNGSKVILQMNGDDKGGKSGGHGKGVT